jgi:beta-galactosidase
MNERKGCWLLLVILGLVLECVAASQGGEADVFEKSAPRGQAGWPGPVEMNEPRLQILFDADWRFHRGDVDGGEKAGLDDSSWRLLSLPHDWSIEDIPGTDSPIDPNAIGGISTGYTVGGTGWYRKTFTVPAKLEGKRFHLQFDGVYMNADVWLNGQHLGNHPYGYTSFWYDITDKIRAGEENILAVEVKNEGKNSRWYSGSGIYRHVWLMALEPVHVAQWGTYIVTPKVNKSSAKVEVRTRVVNDTEQQKTVSIRTRILDSKGLEVDRAEKNKRLRHNASSELKQVLQVKTPELWSTESPVLYTAVTEIFETCESEVPRFLDRIETPFGIRTISFDAQQGFLLNGKPTLLRGGCMHHDNGPLGAAAYNRAEERRVELMKASGFNAIRTAHNPPSPAFLDACDRLGVLVIDEAFDMWRDRKKDDDYHLYFDEWWQRDIESIILRDRNHPSIIMWSIGNEIKNTDKPEVVKVAKMLADCIRRLDSTRAITQGVNGVSEKKDPLFSVLDVCGYNYAANLYESDHKRHPKRVIFASESKAMEAFEYWMAVLDHPWVIGDFVWTGYDYLGEASLGWLGYPHKGSFYPWLHAFCGDIDICGFKRPQSYYRDVLWKHGQKVSIFVKNPQLSFKTNPDKQHWSLWDWHDVAADWNWPGHEDKAMEVQVYSACEQVELLLNGKSLGKKETSRSNQWIAEWKVPYQPGVLKAIGFNGTQEAASWELRTAGQPDQIRLSADRSQIRADGQDLSYVTVEILDANGVRHPKAENLVQFRIEGPGSIAAVGSSNPMGTESFQQPKRRAWQGRCIAIVKSEAKAGAIILKASAEGLKPAQVTITSSL